MGDRMHFLDLAKANVDEKKRKTVSWNALEDES